METGWRIPRRRMSSKDLVRKIHFLFTLSSPCSNSCLVKVQGAGDCRLLERLASAEWCEVPAAGGLPGQPAPRHVSAAGASGHPLHRGPHRRFLLLWLKGIVVEKWNDKISNEGETQLTHLLWPFPGDVYQTCDWAWLQFTAAEENFSEGER